MTRLERSKKQLVDIAADQEQAFLVFQMLINHLPTYQEKTELIRYFREITHSKKQPAAARR